MTDTFTAEVFKLRKRPAVLTVLAVWLALAVVFGYVFPYFNYTGLDDAAAAGDSAAALQGLLQALPDNWGLTSIRGLPMFAGALAILLGVLAAGSEYAWRTQKMILTQGPGRTRVMAGKFAALVLLLLVILACSFAVNAGASALVANATDRAITWPAFADLLAAFGGGLLIGAVWCTFGVLMGTLLRGTALPIGLGLVWALAIENLLRTGAEIPVLGTIQQYTPGSAGGSLVAALGAVTQGEAGGTPGISNALTGTTAVVVLFIYLVVFVSATLTVVRKRDVE
ncbi:MAG TPA: ABC transporter permease subunit [Glycomyces sp.]|nr:ABC transporter permease subunit [Glycomyces sp.]